MITDLSNLTRLYSDDPDTFANSGKTMRDNNYGTASGDRAKIGLDDLLAFRPCALLGHRFTVGPGDHNAA